MPPPQASNLQHHEHGKTHMPVSVSDLMTRDSGLDQAHPPVQQPTAPMNVVKMYTPKTASDLVIRDSGSDQACSPGQQPAAPMSTVKMHAPVSASALVTRNLGSGLPG